MTKIDSFKGKYSFLSNFAPTVFRYEGVQYSSVEAAFQAAKTHDIKLRRRLNCGESYGWVVDPSEAQEAYDFACEYFGKENLDDQIVYSLGNDALSDCLAYIFRMNDFREWEAYKNGEDLDEEDY